MAQKTKYSILYVICGWPPGICTFEKRLNIHDLSKEVKKCVKIETKKLYCDNRPGTIKSANVQQKIAFIQCADSAFTLYVLLFFNYDTFFTVYPLPHFST